MLCVFSLDFEAIGRIIIKVILDMEKVAVIENANPIFPLAQELLLRSAKHLFSMTWSPL